MNHATMNNVISSILAFNPVRSGTGRRTQSTPFIRWQAAESFAFLRCRHQPVAAGMRGRNVDIPEFTGLKPKKRSALNKLKHEYI
jgi:hypothetical protein